MTVLYLIVLTVERPTRYEVLNKLSCINASWYEIGDGLRVGYNILKGLAQSNMSNQTRLGEVVQKWLDMNGQGEDVSVTWRTIIDVIKGPLVQNKRLAMKIYEYLKLESSGQQITRSEYVIISLVVLII